MEQLIPILFCWLCLFPILILVFFGVIFGILYRDRRKLTDAWRQLARQAGLAFNAPRWILGRPTLTGDWHGRPVHIYTRSTRMTNQTGVDSYMYMEMPVTLPEGTQFQLQERNLLNQPGRNNIPSGDAEFDQRFIVRGQPPEFIHRFFMNGGLLRLLLKSQYLNLETTQDKLRYRQFNIETNVETMLSLLSLLFDTAEALERS